ncbi:Phosphoinositide phosphatase SAC2 [Morella rubra]|uniref:Phosphoinositide phosphatase SAC2 n=1 Tax=Morella rubra TaxID=262757 RepID=A0A6A1W3K9_9ROSI|nr:Phosphoinositide phosphatase SAC2 [Morella rubra]
MALEKELRHWTDEEHGTNSCYLQKFRLYETRSNFYMIGRDKNRTIWRVLKIDRLDSSELNILEDCTTYSEIECYDLLRRIHEGNQCTGGLKFVTTCYGIIGFIKFLGPYYLLLITKRRKIGAICGHTIYAIAKSEMILIPNSTVLPKMALSKNENRYKKLLCTVDLTKDFFFSYSYHVMRSLQNNLSDNKAGEFLYETMFVWNEFLTRGIRNNLKNTLWTVALVYGFFKQVKLSVSDRDFNLTLIARRSRHYAGTRYLKRGVNEKGRVANDVETEQIVFEDSPGGYPTQISSIVQNRGSIPLFWSQETSRLNIKPDIILSKKDHNYEATRLHFENLVRRYGNPILILNLIKTRERKPRETILRAEFANAIRFINKNLTVENRLRFLHWDLHRHSTSKATNVLTQLGKVAAYALNATGIFYCQMKPNSRPEGLLNCSFYEKSYGDNCYLENLSSRNDNSDNLENEVSHGCGSGDGNGDHHTRERKPRETILRAEFANAIRFINKNLTVENRLSKATNVLTQLGKVAAYALNATGIFYCQMKPNSRPEGLLNCSFYEKSYGDNCYLENLSSRNDNSDNLENEVSHGCGSGDGNGDHHVKTPMFQKGVLRSNCIDCLDRTNVAQYAYGLVALGRQLHALGFLDSPNIDLNDPLAEDLMGVYETMGDTLALQYGGSPAHNKIFSERRGQWKAATQSQEFFRTLQRFYSNTCMDPEKQNAINVFLGYFQPQPGKPDLWELDSDQHYKVVSHTPNFAGENQRSFIKRSLSDGNILCERDSDEVSTDVGHQEPLSGILKGGNTGLSESTPEISTCESDMSCCRFTPSMSCRKLFTDMLEDQCPISNDICYDDRGDACNCSNFLDVEWLSSSGNSCEEEIYERSLTSLSSDNVVDGLKLDTTTSASETSSSMREREQTGMEIACDEVRAEFSESFASWVTHGGVLLPPLRTT